MQIISRIGYDPTTDKLVGFDLPVDENFLPLTDSFLATSFEQIEEMFRKESGPNFAFVAIYGMHNLWHLVIHHFV